VFARTHCVLDPGQRYGAPEPVVTPEMPSVSY